MNKTYIQVHRKKKRQKNPECMHEHLYTNISITYIFLCVHLHTFFSERKTQWRKPVKCQESLRAVDTYSHLCCKKEGSVWQLCIIWIPEEKWWLWWLILTQLPFSPPFGLYREAYLSLGTQSTSPKTTWEMMHNKEHYTRKKSNIKCHQNK